MTTTPPLAQRPIRFSVGPPGLPVDARELAAFARRIEELGYSAIGIGDHPATERAGPLVAMCAAASATTTLRIGAHVFGNDYRHPAVLAQEIASLDQFSNGRVEVGIGAGWMSADYERLGIAYDRPGVRIERLAEAVRILRACLSGERIDHDGTYYRLAGHTGRPRPVQLPHPPIMVAGGGPKVLALAADEADIVGVNIDLGAGRIDPSAGASGTADATADKVALIRDRAAARGANPELHIVIHRVVITDDREAALADVAGGFGVSVEEAARSPHLLVGSLDEIEAQVLALRADYGITYLGVDGGIVDALAPVVARVCSG
ncbi:MAG: TIGR03621 family F420-dependent LLM class oxidoreductase [Acidimicrobiales bacterium]|nr:TIGR03621 family F420-dependent LLM class oxidoreductase [Acidimicrobiales bacterium]